MTDLAAFLEAVERGDHPPVDLGVTLFGAPAAGKAAVLGFTGHAVVAADVDAVWLASALPAGDPGAEFNPPFLGGLERRLGLRVNNIDILMLGYRSVAPAARAALPTGEPMEPPALREIRDRDHPRVQRALRYRDDVRVWSCDAGGVLVLGRGLGGRWEVAIEVEPEARGKGLGGRLARAALDLVDADRPVWAEVGVGNAASVRAFLRAGYVPIGQEALLVGHR